MNYISILDSLRDQVITLNLKKELYSKSTLLKACYKFTDLFYIFIHQNSEDQSLYTIYFQLKDKNTRAEDLVGKFNNELLDQELRKIVLSETQKVRDTIVTRALLSGQPNDN
jgi:His-Xaa-Ser system protein HxsD|tara:strand:+ start:3303 stop:3638 length:336 start_codon:yes stop_codon:yes gene_type:complete